MTPEPPLEAPLRLEPRLVRRVWGGAALREVHPGAPESGPEGEPVGESWLADASSVVLNGPLAGETLAALAERNGTALLGEASVARYGRRMALLVKLIDAAQDLSVQVHPDDAYALTREAGSGHLGKAEAWYVLAAAPGAAVLRGFVRTVTAEEVRAAAIDGSLPALLRRLPVAPGDVVVNPPGTVHAIGAGVLVYEVQQSSDITYRLFDHGRLDASGRPRELHLDKALEVADLAAAPDALPRPTEARPGAWRRLVSRPEFVLDGVRLAPGARARGATTAASCQLLTAVSGAAELACATGTEPLAAGETLLLPPGVGAYQLAGEGEVLRAAVA